VHAAGLVIMSQGLPGPPELKQAAGGRNVVVLGANVARQFLDADLLDEIIVHFAPVLLGGGVRLFEREGGGPVRLRQLAALDEGRPRWCVTRSSPRPTPRGTRVITWSCCAARWRASAEP
jgi:hypothetical protein